MGQLKKLISALSTRQLITIVATALLAIASLVYLSRWRTESDFHPLYTGLAPEDAGAVVQKLKEAGVDFRLSENGATVLVPSARTAELRLEMASAGIPKSGRIGFELFDKSNLGVTEFAEHVNYERALAGELERSITSLSEVEQARVHLTFPKDSVFLESKQPGKASVVLRLRPSAKLSAQNVNAIVNLVASAVEGLGPESVALVDSRGTLLNRPRRPADADNAQPSEATLEYRQKIESDLLAKINATLDPLIGSEKFRAGVSVECDFSSGEQSEESIDPTKSVMLTSQKTEENAGTAATSGTPGTAANLPRPPAARTGAGTGGTSRRSENISYQTGRTVRHVKLPQGTIKRISISVLVDHDLKWEGAAPKQKRVLTAPTPARLKTIRDLVAGAAGLNTERGDQLIVETLPFEATSTAEPPSLVSGDSGPDPRIPKWLQPLITNPRNLVIVCIAAVVVPLLLIVWIFLMKRSPKVSAASLTAIEERGPAELDSAGETAAQKQLQAETSARAGLTSVTTKSEVLLTAIRESIKTDNASTINVLRTWMADLKGPDEPA